MQSVRVNFRILQELRFLTDQLCRFTSSQVANILITLTLVKFQF